MKETEWEDDGRQSIAQQILQESTDLLRRIIVPVEGQGEVTLTHVCPHRHRYPLEDYIWWVSSGHGKKQCNWWCAAASATGRTQTESWSYKTARTGEKQKSFEHTRRHTESVTNWSTRSNLWPTSRNMVTPHSTWWYRTFKWKVDSRLWPQKVHRGREPWGGERWFRKEHGVEASGEAEVHDRLSWSTREGADELTLRREEGMLRTIIDITGVTIVGGASAREWGLACGVSSHCPRSRGTRMGDHVFTNTRSCTKRSNVRHLKTSKEHRNRCLRHGQRAADPKKIPRKGARLVLWQTHGNVQSKNVDGSSRQQWGMCEVPRQCFRVRGVWLVLLWLAHHAWTTHAGCDVFWKWGQGAQFLGLVPGRCGAKQLGHGSGKFLWRRGACKDSSELSSGDGSPLPRDASCVAVRGLPEGGKWCAFAVTFFLVCWGRNLSSRHLGCRCCTEFRQSGTACVVTKAMLPRRHCLKAQHKTKHRLAASMTTESLRHCCMSNDQLYNLWEALHLFEECSMLDGAYVLRPACWRPVGKPCITMERMEWASIGQTRVLHLESKQCPRSLERHISFQCERPSLDSDFLVSTVCLCQPKVGVMIEMRVGHRVLYLMVEFPSHHIQDVMFVAMVYTDTPHTSFFSCTMHVFSDVQSHHLAQNEPLNVSV